MNFVAVDVETANANMASICSIGFVYFKDGVVARRLGFLIDPEDYFAPINISIHGIRPEQVVGAPTMRKAFPLIANALVTTTVVHHTHFDRVASARPQRAMASLIRPVLGSTALGSRGAPGSASRGEDMASPISLPSSELLMTPTMRRKTHMRPG